MVAKLASLRAAALAIAACGPPAVVEPPKLVARALPPVAIDTSTRPEPSRVGSEPSELAAVGDPCGATSETYTCALDHRALLVCRDARFAVATYCKGPSACQLTGNVARCDTAIGDPGDPCLEGATACSVEHDALLGCRKSALVVLRTCRGAEGCRVPDDGIARCDDTLARAGDPCETNGAVACSVDGRSLLACRQGMYAKKLDCKRGTRCEVRYNQLSCAR